MYLNQYVFFDLQVIAAVWGQFLYHDVAHTPQMAGHLGQRLKCCNVEFEDFHPECYPIKISEKDPFYKKFGLQCQEYARSGTASRVGCTLGTVIIISIFNLLTLFLNKTYSETALENNFFPSMN